MHVSGFRRAIRGHLDATRHLRASRGHVRHCRALAPARSSPLGIYSMGAGWDGIWVYGTSLTTSHGYRKRLLIVLSLRSLTSAGARARGPPLGCAACSSEGAAPVLGRVTRGNELGKALACHPAQRLGRARRRARRGGRLRAAGSQTPGAAELGQSSAHAAARCGHAGQGRPSRRGPRRQDVARAALLQGGVQRGAAADGAGVVPGQAADDWRQAH